MAQPQYERKALPPDRSHKGWAQWLLPLMGEPGQPFRFPRSSRGAARQLAYALRTGQRQPPPGRWEFTSRGPDMYATYLGPLQ